MSFYVLFSLSHSLKAFLTINQSVVVAKQQGKEIPAVPPVLSTGLRAFLLHAIASAAQLQPFVIHAMDFSTQHATPVTTVPAPG